MGTHIEGALERVRMKIEDEGDHGSSDLIARFHFRKLGDHFALEFYGSPWGAGFANMLRELASEPLASSIASLRMSGPDEGANGTKNWDLTPLARSTAQFSNLRYFYIERNQPTFHNQPIVGAVYDEGGVLARVAKKAPRLTEITTPSAPSAAFFANALSELECLNVDAGYATQDFILNFSRSSCFPRLRSVEWGEFSESYLKDWQAQCTPFAHYQALFRSEAFRPVKRFVFKNPVCSESELAELSSMRPDLSILVVRSRSEYLRPYRA